MCACAQPKQIQRGVCARAPNPLPAPCGAIPSPASTRGAAGYLQKRGHLIRSYRTRYFIVRGNVFAYYKNAEDAARHDFRGAHVVTGAELNKENEVVIRTYLGKSFTVRSAPDMPDETVLDARDIHRIFEDAAKLKVKGSQETLQSFTPSVGHLEPLHLLILALVLVLGLCGRYS